MRGSRAAGRGQAAGLLLARLLLGLIFFMAGWWKVFVMGPAAHAEKFFLPYADTFLPVWSLWVTGTAIPVVELAAGGLLLAGWRRREALLSLGIVLVIVTFGHLLKEPLYAFHQHVIPRAALVILLLLAPPEMDAWSLDEVLARKRG